MATPARINAGSYFPVKSYRAPKTRENISFAGQDQIESHNSPPMGGPMKDAIPWKSRRSPKAFVKFSKPNKSTRMTDVSPKTTKKTRVRTLP